MTVTFFTADGVLASLLAPSVTLKGWSVWANGKRIARFDPVEELWEYDDKYWEGMKVE